MFNIRYSIFLVIMIKIVSGQSFLYNPSQTHSHIELGDFVAPTGTIQNISDDSLSLALVRTELLLPTDWENKLCFGGICFPPDWDSLATTNAGAPFYQEPIPPDSTIYFSVWFTAFSEYEGTATATIKLYDLNNPENVIIQNYMASTEPFNIINNNNDWNLIGLPLSVNDPSYLEIFTNAILGTLYGFTDTYFQAQNLEEGSGYWLRFGNEGMSVLFGESIPYLTLSLNADWNLITGISDTVSLNQIEDPNEIIVPGTLFSFNGTYEQSSILVPGNGYWIRTTEIGEVTLNSDFTTVNKIAYIDRTKSAEMIEINGKKLFFGISIPDEEILSYSLPPIPPIGAFDVRFAGNTSIINDYGVIEIMNPNNSIHISYDVTKRSEQWILINPNNKDEYLLQGKGNFIIEGLTQELILQKVSNRINPKKVDYIETYPNPFNPVTTIHYTLPKNLNLDGIITIKIIDINGRVIKDLFNGKIDSNENKFQWNGTNNMDTIVSAGVYFINLNTIDFSLTKKLLYLK